MKLASVFLAITTLLTTTTAWAQSSPSWTSYMVTKNPADIVSSPEVASWFSKKVDVTNGSLTAPNIGSPSITGGALDGAQTVPGMVSSASSRSILSHFSDTPNVVDYGATGNGVTDDGGAVAAAIAASHNGTTLFPYTSTGYHLNTGSFPQTTVGHYILNGNMFTGSAIGDPSSGSGLFNSPYTNPWNVTIGDRFHYDPAGYGPQKNNVTYEGLSITCGPNHPVSGDSVSNRHWIACVYRGADTGSGGGTGTSINTEVDNDVLNLSTNSGTAYEIDVNVNGSVADGGISRGIFITGGGVAGNNWNGVALDVQHGTYSGTGSLNWATGVSVRNSLFAYQAYAESDNAGDLFQGYNNNSSLVYSVDTNGYVKGSGFTASSGAGFVSNGAAGSWRYTDIQTNGTDRWQIGADSSQETGGNAGSNFYISRRDDSGVDLGQPLQINRSTGIVTTPLGLVSPITITTPKVCLDTSCARYVYESNNAVYIGNTTNGDVMSIADNGNVRIRGTLTQSVTP